jgi:hypothetical protein
MDPDWGSPTQQVLGAAAIGQAADATVAAIEEYSRWLQNRFLARFGWRAD